MNESTPPSDNRANIRGSGEPESGSPAETASPGHTKDSTKKPPKFGALGTGLLALLIAGLGILLGFWFNWSEQQSKKGPAEKKSARLVDTVKVKRKTARVRVRGMGTVVPAREVIIRPRVSGKIVRQSEQFVPGGRFKEGELMVQLDRTDYRQTLRQRESELAQAKANLEIREGDQAVAREELKLLQGDITGGNRDLILRKPQVNQAKAAVKSAKAALKQAQTDLKRARIAAPFDGHIVSRSASKGSNVSQGEQLATFVGSDRYWINVAIPVAHLRWIKIPNNPNEKGSPVRITNKTAWGEEAYREGYVRQLIGRLENGSRMAQLMVAVPDPLAQSDDHNNKPSLLLGSVVDTLCRGEAIRDVVTIDPAYLRQNNTVWVMNDSNRLEIRSVSVAFEGKQNAYIESGLEDGDRVIMTNLSSPVEDMLLRTADKRNSSPPNDNSKNEGEAGDA